MAPFKKAFKRLQRRQNAYTTLEAELRRAGRTFKAEAFKRPGSMNKNAR